MFLWRNSAKILKLENTRAKSVSQKQVFKKLIKRNFKGVLFWYLLFQQAILCFW